MPVGGARPNAGRKKGIPNRRTQEHLDRARIAEQIVEVLSPEDRKRAEGAAEARESAQARRVKLAKEVLEEFMMLFAGMAAFHQPAPPSAPPNPHADEKRFERYAVLARDTAKDLAPYQSPIFRAIAVMAPPPGDRPPQEGNVVDMSDANVLARVYRGLITGERGKSKARQW